MAVSSSALPNVHQRSWHAALFFCVITFSVIHRQGEPRLASLSQTLFRNAPYALANSRFGTMEEEPPDELEGDSQAVVPAAVPHHHDGLDGPAGAHEGEPLRRRRRRRREPDERGDHTMWLIITCDSLDEGVVRDSRPPLESERVLVAVAMGEWHAYRTDAFEDAATTHGYRGLEEANGNQRKNDPTTIQNFYEIPC